MWSFYNLPIHGAETKTEKRLSYFSIQKISNTLYMQDHYQDIYQQHMLDQFQTNHAIAITQIVLNCLVFQPGLIGAGQTTECHESVECRVVIQHCHDKIPATRYQQLTRHAQTQQTTHTSILPRSGSKIVTSHNGPLILYPPPPLPDPLLWPARYF